MPEEKLDNYINQSLIEYPQSAKRVGFTAVGLLEIQEYGSRGFWPFKKHDYTVYKIEQDQDGQEKRVPYLEGWYRNEDKLLESIWRKSQEVES